MDNIKERVPEVHKAVRVQDLAKAARKFKQQKNYIAMAKMLEQIAKEVGNVHSNRHEFTGKDGGAIKFEDVGDMTDEMLESEIDRLWAKREAAKLGKIIEVTPTTTSKPH